MAKGRRPPPTHLRLVKGNPGKRPINRTEPKSQRERPSAPSHVSDKARDSWGYVSGILDKMGVLTEADAIALEVMCEAYADLLGARRELEAFGSNYYETTIQSGSKMYRAHPAVAVMQDADRRIKSWISEFGMTPSESTRVHSSPRTTAADDLNEFFKS